MSALILNYSELTKVSSNADSIAKKAESYADALTRRIYSKMDSVTGGMNETLSSASYYINAKITELREKKAAYASFAKQVTNLVSEARRIDKEVARTIANNKKEFLKSHSHLQINDWKAAIISWLVDVKNSCPLFEMIGNGLNRLEQLLTSAADNIKYWYKCQGGKEVLAVVGAVAGLIISVALFVATLPASGLVAVCATISALITTLNAMTNVATSFASMIAAKSGDPAWAKIYGDRKTLADFLKKQRFQNWIISDKCSYMLANVVSTVEIFCNFVNIASAIKSFKFKLNFLQNYFDENIGLLSYMKTAQWTEQGTLVVNEKGIVKTQYTAESILRGIKAFVMNKPIDVNSELGIRTLLRQNFCTDFKMFVKSTFNVTGWKDTFVYCATNGGAITFSEWKSTFKIKALPANIKDSVRYYIKNGSFRGAFDSSLSWKKRQEYIKTAANGAKSTIEIVKKAISIGMGEFNPMQEIKGFLIKQSDFTKLIDKIEKLNKKVKETVKQANLYRAAEAAT